MFWQVTGNSEANKKFKTTDGRIAVRFVNKLIEDQYGEPTGRQKVFIQDPMTPGEAQAVIYLEEREPKWVRIGNERYKDLWDFLGYCDISKQKITYKNNRRTKWIVEPDCIRLLPRGRKNHPPLAVFNSVSLGDPRVRVMVEVFYLADDLIGIGIFEILAGVFLMEYLRKRVFMLKTKSLTRIGDGPLNSWSEFRDLVTPPAFKRLPTNPSPGTGKRKPRKLQRGVRRIPLPAKKKIEPPYIAHERMVVAIMSKEDQVDPFGSKLSRKRFKSDASEISF